MEWCVIGHKSEDTKRLSSLIATTGPSLAREIATITTVPEDVLHQYSISKKLPIEEKLQWMVGRSTTRSEDMYYSLLGIFDVRMRLDYGEGRDNARKRLLKQITKRNAALETVGKVVRWLSPPDPWSNHTSARDRHEPGTGEWFLRSDQYQKWIARDVDHVWINAKAGSGKTVLLSTIIEDVRSHCASNPDTGYAVFYFTFSDSRKQDYNGLLLSLVAQLIDREPALSRLYEASQRGDPRREDLETALLTAISSRKTVYLMLDALDEVPEDKYTRQLILDRLTWLTQQAPRCAILSTNRWARDIEAFTERIEAATVPPRCSPG